MLCMEKLRPDLIKIIYKNPRFLAAYDQGMSSYLMGEWIKAMSYLKKALRVKPKDGPTMSILEYMDDFKFVCPKSWEGYRILTEK